MKKTEVKMYACAICGKEYETIAERSTCETECVKRQAEEEKKAAELKKKEEQIKLKEEVDRAMKIATDLLDQYIEKYGEYEMDIELEGIELETEDSPEEEIWPGCIFQYFI